MDLYAQRYVRFQQPLAAPGAPFVSAISSSRLSVSWPPVGGFPVSYYDLYVDGSPAGMQITNIMWTMTNLPPSSTHSFTLDYVLADGRQSPISVAGSGTTWGEDNNFDGLPDDWQITYWGTNPANWPSPGAHLGGPNGPTVATVFQMGANPLNPATWLRQNVMQTASGFYLTWNTQPGFVYQVEVSNDLNTWAGLGSPRFAAGTTDSIFLGLTGSQALFKVRRVRY